MQKVMRDPQGIENFGTLSEGIPFSESTEIQSRTRRVEEHGSRVRLQLNLAEVGSGARPTPGRIESPASFCPISTALEEDGEEFLPDPHRLNRSSGIQSGNFAGGVETREHSLDAIDLLENRFGEGARELPPPTRENRFELGRHCQVPKPDPFAHLCMVSIKHLSD
jgi:hypothetical protein